LPGSCWYLSIAFGQVWSIAITPNPRTASKYRKGSYDYESRVTPAEIRDLLDHALALDRGATLAEQIAYHERKASLLSRIAADLGTTQAHEVAALAWEYLATLVRQNDANTGTEAAS
jgi:hypothetical protein